MGDRVVMGWFDEANIPYNIVLTKSDKVPMSQVVKVANEICMRYHSQIDNNNNDSIVGSQSPIVHVTSAKNGDGISQFMLSIVSDLWVTDDNDDNHIICDYHNDDDDIEHLTEEK